MHEGLLLAAPEFVLAPTAAESIRANWFRL